MTEPHRFSAKSVHRFLPVFVEIVRNGDDHRRICINPIDLGLSMNTCVARLRDAALALTNSKVLHPNIDPADLSRRWKQYEVSINGHLVCAVPKSEKETKPVSAPVLVGEHMDVLAVLVGSDDDFERVISAFALLLGKRFITGKIKITGSFDPQLQERLTNTYDVAVVNEADGWLLF